MTPRPPITLLDVYARLSVACREAGNQRAWAQRHGISATYLSDVLNARTEPGPTMLAALGLVRVVRYVEKRTPIESDQPRPGATA
jgi:hypothetical protein